MKDLKISLAEDKLRTIDGRNMIIKIIDEQINHQKLQFLSDWIRDHKVSFSKFDDKIKRLESMKEEMLAFFSSVNLNDSSVNFTLDLEVKLAIESQNILQENETLLQGVA